MKIALPNSSSQLVHTRQSLHRTSSTVSRYHVNNLSYSLLISNRRRAIGAIHSSALCPYPPASQGPIDDKNISKKTLVNRDGGVHGFMQLSKSWKNKPLFRRQGDVRFKTGIEAANLLVQEAQRRDAHEHQFIDSVTSVMHCLAPIFERNPRYAFCSKQLMEPERFIQFRVPWIDDTGVTRTNRGYRIQYSNALGPYQGALHFAPYVSASVIKSLGFDTVFANSLTGYPVGAAVGGSDINPHDKSEAEMQRFCQSYMTELAKYIGPDIDSPTMGRGVGEKEMGYLFGQYKRIQPLSSWGGIPFLSTEEDKQALGHGVVHFANEILKDRHESLANKRCLIFGSGKVARSVATNLLQYGAIPLTFSDASGHIYEPDGIDEAKLRTISKIKNERGALLGRYIIASTTAKFNDPARIVDIPCDLCFPCASMNQITDELVNAMADKGCMGIIEGGYSTVTPDARKVLKKRGLLYGPHILTMTGSAIHNNALLTMRGQTSNTAMNGIFADEVSRIYSDVKATAQEFNSRGDLFAGANILGFLRVANAMLSQGAI